MCSNTLFLEKFGIIRKIKMNNAEDRTLHDGEKTINNIDLLKIYKIFFNKAIPITE